MNLYYQYPWRSFVLNFLITCIYDLRLFVDIIKPINYAHYKRLILQTFSQLTFCHFRRLRIDKLNSSLTVGQTIESPPIYAQIYFRLDQCILMKLTWFIGNSMSFHNLEIFLKKIRTVECYPKMQRKK